MVEVLVGPAYSGSENIPWGFLQFFLFWIIFIQRIELGRTHSEQLSTTTLWPPIKPPTPWLSFWSLFAFARLFPLHFLSLLLQFSVSCISQTSGEQQQRNPKTNKKETKRRRRVVWEEDYSFKNKMECMKLGFLVLFLLFSSVHGGLFSGNKLPIISFDEGYSHLFGDNNLMVLRDGKSVHLSLDERTG